MPLLLQEFLCTPVSEEKRQGQHSTRYSVTNFAHRRSRTPRRRPRRTPPKRIALARAPSPQPRAPTRRTSSRVSRGVGEDRARDGCLTPRWSRERSWGASKSRSSYGCRPKGGRRHGRAGREGGMAAFRRCERGPVPLDELVVDRQQSAGTFCGAASLPRERRRPVSHTRRRAAGSERDRRAAPLPRGC